MTFYAQQLTGSTASPSLLQRFLLTICRCSITVVLTRGWNWIDRLIWLLDSGEHLPLIVFAPRLISSLLLLEGSARDFLPSCSMSASISIMVWSIGHGSGLDRLVPLHY